VEIGNLSPLDLAPMRDDYVPPAIKPLDFASSPCELHAKVVLDPMEPVSRSVFSEVYRGKIEEREVAIKKLFLPAEKLQVIKKVGIVHKYIGVGKHAYTYTTGMFEPTRWLATLTPPEPYSLFGHI
jgi:hypothetical protein